MHGALALIEAAGPQRDGPRSPDATLDENLLRLHLAGGVGAFEDLLARHEGWVFGYLRARCASDDVASDLFQEVFLRVARGAPGFRFRSRVSPWFFTITRNVLHDQQAKSRKERARFSLGDGLGALASRFKGRGSEDSEIDDNAALLAAVPDTRPLPDRSYEDAERVAHLRNALEELPAKQRDVLLLVKCEGLSLEEAAQHLDMNLNTVKTSLRRGRLRLAQALADAEGGAS